MNLKERIAILGTSDCPIGVNKEHFRKMLRIAEASGPDGALTQQGISSVSLAMLLMLCDLKDLLSKAKKDHKPKPGFYHGTADELYGFIDGLQFGEEPVHHRFREYVEATERIFGGIQSAMATIPPVSQFSVLETER